MNNAIGQRGFAVINVGDDRKITDVFHKQPIKKALEPGRAPLTVKKRA